MQKLLIMLAVGLLAVGCKTLTPEEKKTPEQKQKLRDSIVGEYEFKQQGGNTHKVVLLDNGFREYYLNGKKRHEHKWSIVECRIPGATGQVFFEIHVGESGLIGVHRINPDKSITGIARINMDGKRTDLSKVFQWTYKKIK